jgi:hypothetical protein
MKLFVFAIMLFFSAQAVPQPMEKIRPVCKFVGNIEYCIIPAKQYDALLADYRLIKNQCKVTM